jgi:type I restriction enzyme S subunit
VSELPPNWGLARVGDLIDLGPKNKCPEDTEVGFVPLQRLGVDYRSRHSFEPKPWSTVKKGYTHFADGDVLLARITPSFENGKAGIARGLPNGLGAGSTEYFVCRPLTDALLPEYLLAHFKTPRFLRDGEQVMSGAVGQQRVPKQYVLDSRLPLAPLNEQKRIADKLDVVLARIDACRERLDRIPVILKRFRQSVLAAATSGKLTEEWREETQGKTGCEYHRNSAASFEYLFDDVRLPSTWQLKILGDAAVKIQDGNYGGDYPKENEWTTTGVPFITGTALGPRGNIVRENLRFVSEDKNRILTKAQIKPGDIIFPNRGARDAQRSGYEPMGYLIPEAFGEANINPQLTLVRVGPMLINTFAKLCIDSEFFLAQHRLATTGSALAFINLSKTRAVAIPIPPISEQTEIVRRTESLFAYADRLEARYTAARVQVERLTQALLAKAFRGELVPQDPNDEPASVLLERIRAAREAAPAKSRQRKGSSQPSKTQKAEVTMLDRKDIQDALLR